jgi:N-formylglutamate deformylase
MRPTAEQVPVLVTIPHTGTRVPAGIAARFASAAIRRLPMTDWHLHALYDFLPGLGIEVLHASWHRFVVDLNRPPEPRALYPGRFETGLVAERTFQGEPIYASPPDADEVRSRKALYYEPYHRRLAERLEDIRTRFGSVILIDAHSVASAPSLLHDRLTADIYLGNRDGVTCGPALVDYFASAFERAGCGVALNAPYKGGYTTDHYGRLPGVQALQIEMCQRVYMDEADPDGAPNHPRFEATRSLLRNVFAGLLDTIETSP